MTFGERLSEIRKGKDFSMTDMATRLSISVPGYKRLEDGTGAKTFEKLPLIAKTLGCRIDDLFPEMDEDASAPEQTEEERKTARACGFEENEDLKGWSE